MKKYYLYFLISLLLLSMTACSYHPPEGWTKKHHTYEEVLAFAKSIDPNATVTEEYTDTLDEYEWEYREWDAIINGVECHVSSVSDWVWNDGVAAGEFIKVYYRIDTDYDYTVMKNIVSEKYPEWKCGDTMRSKYHQNTNTISVDLTMPEIRMLNDDELERVWQIAWEINEEYEKIAIERKARFCIPSPGEYWNQYEEKYIVKKDSFARITDFSEDGKEAFLKEYMKDWALLESDSPVN